MAGEPETRRADTAACNLCDQNSSTFYNASTPKSPSLASFITTSVNPKICATMSTAPASKAKWSVANATMHPVVVFTSRRLDGSLANALDTASTNAASTSRKDSQGHETHVHTEKGQKRAKTSATEEAEAMSSSGKSHGDGGVSTPIFSINGSGGGEHSKTQSNGKKVAFSSQSDDQENVEIREVLQTLKEQLDSIQETKQFKLQGITYVHGLEGSQVIKPFTTFEGYGNYITVQWAEGVPEEEPIGMTANELKADSTNAFIIMGPGETVRACGDSGDDCWIKYDDKSDVRDDLVIDLAAVAPQKGLSFLRSLAVSRKADKLGRLHECLDRLLGSRVELEHYRELVRTKALASAYAKNIETIAIKPGFFHGDANDAPPLHFPNPVGEVIGYCGKLEALANNPNFLLCDGRELNRHEYPQLFAALYGEESDETKFKIPDLRGYFVRGAGPDLPVGTKQDASIDEVYLKKHMSIVENGNHKHNAKFAHPRFLYYANTNPIGEYPVLDEGNETAGLMEHPKWLTQPTSESGNHGHEITFGTGTETRPKNVSVWWLIRAR